jgi:hypothetical protein
VLKPDGVETVGAPLVAARDAALLQLGRNLVLFQQLESGLKAFYQSLVIEGSDPEDVERRRLARSDTIANQSLGSVAKRLLDELALSEDDREPPSTPAPAIRFRIRFAIDAPQVEARRAALDSLIAERNRLVHRITDDYELQSAEGIARLDAHLATQAERIRAEYRAWQALFEEQGKSRAHLGAFLGSVEFREYYGLELLRRSTLVHGMALLALELPRADGWTVFDRALAKLCRSDPDALTDLAARFGDANVRQLLAKSGAFKFQEEPTANGTRLLYRPNRDA